MGREENILIFRDTERLCKDNPVLSEAIKVSTENQKLILENDALEKPELHKYSEPAKLVVSKKRSYEAAAGYKQYKTCVHNFASASTPGGGVVKGSGAQEECLCRTSSLYFSLNTPQMWEGFYTTHRQAQDPIHNDDIIYTPGVVVFKTDTASPVLMPQEEWYQVDVITCAAPNLRLLPCNPMNPGDGSSPVKVSDEKLFELHVKRLRRILDVAVSEGCEAIILGAFGCGAFENDPEVVAQAAETVVKEYLYAFKAIEFAVYCSPRDERNFEVFKRLR